MMQRMPRAQAARPALVSALICALFGASVAQAAEPVASCLDTATLAAARTHQFQTMMMTVSLRCKTYGVDVETSFSQMMQVHQAVFSAADKAVHGYIGPAHGFADKRAYDTYATLVANRYGGGATNPMACAALDRAIKSVIADTSGSKLHFVASAMIAKPEMERFACAPAQQGAPASVSTAVAMASPQAQPKK